MAEAEEEMEHPRLIMHNFLSLEECKELEFIHKSCCTTGYRPNVFSTTLSHLIFTNSAHLIIPFVPIRERLKDKAEEFFHCEYELFIEFTGLISWTQGASIGWHSDDNRAYLKQRDFAAVCYLNNYGEDFKGGLFHFQDGDPTTVMPMAGDVLMYTADDRNIHSVDEITDGERLTLTLWFSRDNSHDEDAKLVSILSHSVGNKPDSCIPLPGSTCMYWFPPGQATLYQSGFDIRWARLLALGFDLYSSHESSSVLSSADRMSELSNDPHSSDRISELLMEPLQVARENELFEQEFANIMHVLQVVQFYYWKASEMQTPNVIRETCNKVVQLSKSQMEKINSLRSIFLKDHKMAETVFNRVTCGKSGALLFNWAGISAAVAAWDEYTCKLCKDIVTNLPYWRTQQSIFSVPFSEC